MNKKKLLALPVVCVVVAMIGASVIAAGSVQKGIKVTDEDGNDITIDYSESETTATGPVLADLEGIQEQISAVNDKAKVEDAELVYKADITEDKAHDGTKTVTFNITALFLIHSPIVICSPFKLIVAIYSPLLIEID